MSIIKGHETKSNTFSLLQSNILPEKLSVIIQLLFSQKQEIQILDIHPKVYWDLIIFSNTAKMIDSGKKYARGRITIVNLFLSVVHSRYNSTRDRGMHRYEHK